MIRYKRPNLLCGGGVAGEALTGPQPIRREGKEPTVQGFT